MRALKLTYKGVTKTLPEWAREKKIPPSTLYHRVRVADWPMEKALNTPKGEPERYEYQGKMYTIGQLAAIHGNIGPSGIDIRLKRGMSVEDAVTVPNQRPRRGGKDNPAGAKNRPALCCHPECDNCPYSDCRW